MKKLMILAALALLAAPVINTSGTMVFAEDNADTTTSSSSSESTGSGIERLKKCETKAQLFYKYTVDTVNGITNYNISDIGLRFGGVLDQETIYAIYENMTYYGVTYSTISPESKKCESFVDGLNDGHYKIQEKDSDKKISDYEALYGKQSGKTSSGFPSLPPYYQDADGNYFNVFSVFINVDNNSLDKTIYAVASVTFKDEGQVYLKETAYSVESIAKAYIADTETFAKYSSDVQNTLTMLSQGFTSGKSTDSTK